MTFRSASSVLRNGVSVAVPVPTGVQDGDLLLMAITWLSGTAAPTTPAGWTLVDLLNVAPSGVAVYKRIASSEPASYLVTCGFAEFNCVNSMYAFMDVDEGAAINVFSKNSSVQINSATATGVTTTVDDCDLLFLSHSIVGGL